MSAGDEVDHKLARVAALPYDQVAQFANVARPCVPTEGLQPVGSETALGQTLSRDRLLEERGEIPYRVTMEPAGTDVLGRPYYLPKEHPLNTEWLERKSALKGADALLTVRRIDVGATTLRQTRWPGR